MPQLLLPSRPLECSFYFFFRDRVLSKAGGTQPATNHWQRQLAFNPPVSRGHKRLYLCPVSAPLASGIGISDSGRQCYKHILPRPATLFCGSHLPATWKASKDQTSGCRASFHKPRYIRFAQPNYLYKQVVVPRSFRHGPDAATNATGRRLDFIRLTMDARRAILRPVVRPDNRDHASTMIV